MIIDLLNKVQGSDVRLMVEFGEDLNQSPVSFLLKDFHLELYSEPRMKVKDGNTYCSLGERTVKLSGIMKDELWQNHLNK